MKLTTKVIIDRPARQVWEYMDNPDNLGKWLRGFKKFEPVSGEPGQPGAISRHYYEENGRETVFEEEILERRPHELFFGRMTHPWMDFTIKNHFRELDDSRTEMTVEADYTFKSLFMRLFGWAMKGSFKKRTAEDLNRFKEQVEREMNAA